MDKVGEDKKIYEDSDSNGRPRVRCRKRPRLGAHCARSIP